jgi:hypothetical protein
MSKRSIVFLLSGLALSVLVACSGNQTPESPVANWQFDGATHQVVSGIAGNAPESWIERGWADDSVVIYLADQEITCNEFPTEVTNEFPPRPVANGATIMLYITESNDTDRHHGSFDIVTRNSQSGSSVGLSTDVRAGLITRDEGRVYGWLEHNSSEDDTPEVTVSGTFEVPFCV